MWNRKEKDLFEKDNDERKFYNPKAERKERLAPLNLSHKIFILL